MAKLPKGWSKADEYLFKRWYGDISGEMGLSANPDDPLHYYDWRAAWKAGASPGKGRHWPSEFKLEGHPREVINGMNTRLNVPQSFLGLLNPSDIKWGWTKDTGRIMQLLRAVKGGL